MSHFILFQTTQSNANTKNKGKSGKGDGNKDSQKKKNTSQEQWDQWKKKDSEVSFTCEIISKTAININWSVRDKQT